MNASVQRRASVRAAPAPFAMIPPAGDDLVEAIRLHAEAMQSIASAIDRGADKVAPIADFFGSADTRLDKLCAFLKRWWLPFLASIPGVAVSIGAMTPNAAAALKALIAGFGAG